MIKSIKTVLVTAIVLLSAVSQLAYAMQPRMSPMIKAIFTQLADDFNANFRDSNATFNVGDLSDDLLDAYHSLILSSNVQSDEYIQNLMHFRKNEQKRLAGSFNVPMFIGSVAKKYKNDQRYVYAIAVINEEYSKRREQGKTIKPIIKPINPPTKLVVLKPTAKPATVIATAGCPKNDQDWNILAKEIFVFENVVENKTLFDAIDQWNQFKERILCGLDSLDKDVNKDGEKIYEQNSNDKSLLWIIPSEVSGGAVATLGSKALILAYGKRADELEKMRKANKLESLIDAVVTVTHLDRAIVANALNDVEAVYKLPPLFIDGLRKQIDKKIREIKIKKGWE